MCYIVILMSGMCYLAINNTRPCLDEAASERGGGGGEYFLPFVCIHVGLL